MKKTKANLITINVIFVVCLIIANIVTAKVINTGIYICGSPILIPGAALTYALTFLCTDIIGEVWGKNEANSTVWRGFFAQFIALALIIATQYLPSHNEDIQKAYVQLLGQTPVFVIGSLIGYLSSQTWDVWIFHKIRERFKGNPKYRWIWNNVSTMTSQIIDTSIYITIAFGLGLGWFWQDNGIQTILLMILGQYVFKFLIAILDTPIFYLFTNRKKISISTHSTDGY